MIAHQNIRMDRTFAVTRGLGQAFEIKAAIDLAKEAGGAVIPPLDDVKRNSGKL
jgi:hypothetical protein